jgi:acyl dehydratase
VTEELPVWQLPAVDPQRMKMLALLLRDPNPIHWDPEATRRLGLGEKPVNQGPANLAYVLNMLHEAFPDHTVARLETRFLGSVYAGDHVLAGGRVTGRNGREMTCEAWLDREATGAAALQRVLSTVATLREKES